VDGWCDKCKAKGLVANFENWISGNNDIDAFIQETQEMADDSDRYLEWIEPRQITDIRLIADGGFASVYQAIWMNAPKDFNTVLRMVLERSLSRYQLVISALNGVNNKLCF
jgi:hypothetical protein